MVAIGVAIPLLPLTALWAFQYGLQLDWLAFWRAAVDTWLLGHGVDVRFTLDATTAAGLGLPGAEAPATVTIALLGFALLTLLLGVRAGRRIGETRRRLLGELVSLGTFAAASTLLTLSAVDAAAAPTLWQGVVLPTLVFAIGLAIGIRIEDEDAGGRTRALWTRLPERPRRTVVAALRAGTGAAAGLLAVAAVLTALAIVVSFAQIITLYESLHGEVLGGAAITVGQLALLPNLVVWAASWLVGPGFAIGAGSSIGPLGAAVGPIPAIPVLGALPTGDLPLGFLGLLAPVLVAFLIGLLMGQRTRFELTPGYAAAAAGAGGLVGGLLLGLLVWAASGGAGPGRLAQVGADPIAVGAWAAVEFAVALAVGGIAGRRLPARR